MLGVEGPLPNFQLLLLCDGGTTCPRCIPLRCGVPIRFGRDESNDVVLVSATRPRAIAVHHMTVRCTGHAAEQRSPRAAGERTEPCGRCSFAVSPGSINSPLYINNIRVSVLPGHCEIQLRAGDVIALGCTGADIGFRLVSSMDVGENNPQRAPLAVGPRRASPVLFRCPSPTAARPATPDSRAALRAAPIHRRPSLLQVCDDTAPRVAPRSAIAPYHSDPAVLDDVRPCAACPASDPGNIAGQPAVLSPFELSKEYLCMHDSATRAFLPLAESPKFERVSREQLITARGLGLLKPTISGAIDEPRCKALRFIEGMLQRYKANGNTFAPLADHVTLLRSDGPLLVGLAKALVAAESPFINDVRTPAWCCGDLHGSFADLVTIVEQGLPFGQVKFQSTPFVFLGDYVDRGDHSLEVALFLLAWKVIHPSLVVLLRGNHEDPAVNGDTEQYGDASFLARCTAILGPEDGTAIWSAINDVFAALPIAAQIDRSVFVCHGGVPHLQFSDLESVMRKLTLLSRSEGTLHTQFKSFVSLMPQDEDDSATAACRRLAREIVWNDPTQEEAGGPLDAWGFRCNVGRGDTDGVIHEFSKDAAEAFLTRFGWSLLIRAHQHKSHGLEVAHCGNVITLFSSCNYSDANAAGACFLSPDRRVHLLSWRRTQMSPQRSSSRDTAVPVRPGAVSGRLLDTASQQWSCGVLPSSCRQSTRSRQCRPLACAAAPESQVRQDTPPDNEVHKKATETETALPSDPSKKHRVFG